MGLYLAGSLAFVAAAAAVLALAPLLIRVWWQGDRRVRRRLTREFGTTGSDQDLAAFKDLQQLTTETVTSEVPSLWRRFASMVERSGLKVTPVHLLVVSGVCGFCVGVGVGLWRGNPALGLAGGAIATVAPLLYVRGRARARDDRLLAQLPEILDLMARFLRTGHSLPQALRAVAQEFRDPAREIFSRCVVEQDLGLSPEPALRQLADRADLTEYRIVIMAILVQQQTGGNLTQICERLAWLVRERFRVRGLIQALTAEGRMQAKILTGLPVAVFLAMLMLKPSYAKALLAQPALLVGIVVSQVLGLLWIRRIVAVRF